MKLLKKQKGEELPPPIRPMSMVRINIFHRDLRKKFLKPFKANKVYIFLGEIVNMPGHGVFVDHEKGKVYSGYHIDQFEEVPDEET